MKNIKKIAIFIYTLFFFPSTVALAQGLDSLDPTLAAGGSAFQLIDSVMNRVPYFLGGLAFLALLVSGGIYLFSFGDPTRMETAKKNLTWTVIGILAAASVFVVIKIILWVTNPASLA